MLGLQGQAQPSPTIGDALNAGHLYLEVRCLGCDTPSAEISIDHEEQRAFNYVARQLKDRRDNLLLTISILENHLNYS